MAGGSGTRLWPASVDAHPKQFIRLKDGKSLLQLTVERACAVNPEGKILIVTHQHHGKLAAEHVGALAFAKDNVVILPEPEGKNTAPAIASACAYLSERGSDADTVLIASADHLITPVKRFREVTESASRLAEQGFIAVYGIPPSRPETGYGYIEAGEPMNQGFRVVSFKEKPDGETARRFVDSGAFYWNSGMFVTAIHTFRKELSCHCPEVHEQFERVRIPWHETTESGVRIAEGGETLAALYKAIPSISIDYAIMEKTSCAAMVRGDFHWSDIGCWEEFAQLHGGDEANVVGIQEKNNFVYSDVPVVLCGVEDLMVVAKNGKILVCRKGSGQDVKKAVERMKAFELG